MHEHTRMVFNQMLKSIAETYGVDDTSKLFAATPTVEQKLIDKIEESSDFLKKINVTPVRDLKGEKVIGGVPGHIGKRTDTTAADRKPVDALNLDSQGYELNKTEYDIYIRYATIDAWSKFPDFNNRFLRYVREAIARSRLSTGWYGESMAPVTDIETNPNGEDLHHGWFQVLRDYNAGAQFLSQGDTVNEIRLGGAGDYVNLDDMVNDIKRMLPVQYRNRKDLVAYIGTDLLGEDKSALYKSQGNTPTEKDRISAAIKEYGGLPAETPDLFPERGLMITTPKNLSIYYQSGHVRQKIEDNAKRDQVEHYNTLNEDYIVEVEDMAAAIEFKNVRIWDGNAFA